MLKLTDFHTTPTSSKLWITPENDLVALNCWHFEYFRDPEVSKKYGVPFGDEVATRLTALRVGFVRGNYERNGGALTLESIRWDRKLRNVVDELVMVNVDAIDTVRFNIVETTGQLTQLGVVSPMDLRARGVPIDRYSLGSWNNFRTVKIDILSGPAL